jgi:PAS domain S-box-containing protein
MTAPFVAVIGYEIYSDMQQSIAATKSTLRSLASTMVSNTGNEIANARQILERIAARPLVRRVDPKNCDGALKDLLSMKPGYADIGYSDLNGRVVCSAMPQPGGKPVHVGNAPWFQKFLKEKSFIAGEPFLGPINGKSVSVFSAPIWNERHEMIGGVHLPLDLAAFDPHIPAQLLPANSRYGFFSEDGVLIWLNVDPNRAIGTRPSADASRRLFDVRNGEFEGVAGDGVRRFYSVVPMPEAGWIAFVDVPVSEIYGPAKKHAATATGIVLITTLILLMCALAIARRIARPVAALERVARAIHHGDLTARATVAGPQEISAVAREFNAMIGAVQHHETEIKKLNLALEQRVEERTRAFQESEGRFRGLTELSSDWYWEQDENFRFTMVSSAFARDRSIEPKEYLGKARWETGIKPEPGHDLAAHRAVLEAHLPYRDFEFSNLIDGELNYISVSGVPLFDDQGRFIGYRGVGRRITERKLAEQQLREAKEAAEAGNRAKSEFLATVSHELRTPLHAISAFTEIALDTPGLPQESRAHLEHVMSSSRVLRRHIDDLLDASRLEYGKLSLVAMPFDLESCCQEPLEMLAARAEAKGLEFVLRFAAGTPRVVIGDALRLGQVITNLVDNAIRFTEAGHVLVEVSGRAAEPQRAELRIAVEDTGIGVPETQRSRIFDKFVQANGSLTRSHDGFGLGLALSRQIVDQMGGRIELESTSASGSRFAVTLTLPLDPQATNDDAAGKTYRLREARVLIVEDKALTGNVLQEYVLNWRMRNGIARDGEEALRLLRQARAQGDPYRFAIIGMPLADMPVEQLAGQLRADPGLRETLVLLLAPAGREAPGTLHLQAPVVGHLNRPVSPSQLMDAMVTVWAAWAERNPPSRATPPPAPRPDAGDQCRVLLVEDNDLVRRSVTMMLGRLNCRVDMAENGAAGAAKAAGEEYDIIFMDLQMPLMDGFAATEQIRALAGPRGRVPIVALTAHAGEADRRRCLQAGMDGHIAKPAEMDDLRRGLERWARKPAAPAADGEARPDSRDADRSGE